MRGKLETNLSFEVTALRTHVDAIRVMIHAFKGLFIIANLALTLLKSTTKSIRGKKFFTLQKIVM